jgi:ABC-type multidrug transport system fused ATPase/permease subunit
MSMLNIVKELFQLLSPVQRKQFYLLQVLVVLMAFTELVGIASIAPFMAIVGDVSLLNGDGLFAKLYEMTGINDPMDFLFYLGLCVLLALTLSTFISMFTIWKLSMYAARVGTELADNLYEYYMTKDWLFHSEGSSAYLTKQISTEAMRVTDQIIQPLMQMNAKLILALFISISILIYNPLIAITGLIIFGLAYFLLFRLVRVRLQNNGNKMSNLFTERFKLMNEGFGGIKDVLLLNRQYDFVIRFQKSGRDFAKARGTNIGINQVPRYFMELIAFGAMIVLVLVLIKLHHGDLGAILPIIAVYALAAFKLLPALQQVYSSLAQIKGNVAAFDSIKNDLHGAVILQNITKTKANQKYLNRTSIEREVSLDKINFRYPNKSNYAVKNLSLDILKNSLVGIVGASGSGKSTVIDILIGLLKPDSGKIRIDGNLITDNNIRYWQNNIGFVPQSIYLSEGTIAENVAFGVPAQNIDIELVYKALNLSHLTETIEQLPNGIHTTVGERGVQLSGGQRQRIGIARALYNEAEVLVFDEATSALDGITEKVIMDAIYDFTGKKTIIMIAHRLQTVKKCDVILIMDKGEIVDQGSYSELYERNTKFKLMAENS